MDFFDEVFELETFRISEPGPAVVAHTTATWTFRHRAPPRAATSESASQTLRTNGTCAGTPVRLTAVMSGHTCTRFDFRAGQAPSAATGRQAVKQSSVDLHLEPEALMRP